MVQVGSDSNMTRNSNKRIVREPICDLINPVPEHTLFGFSVTEFGLPSNKSGILDSTMLSSKTEALGKGSYHESEDGGDRMVVRKKGRPTISSQRE